MMNKKNLLEQIEAAQTDEQLRGIVDAIPRQENGHRHQIANILDDAFWYIDLDTVDSKKSFMLDRINFYLKQ